MIKRSMQSLLLVAVVLGVTLGIFCAPAMAEQCSTVSDPYFHAEKKTYEICLVTDTSQPLVSPANLLFKVPSEATRFTGRLVQQGPGDTNLWESELPVNVLDGIVEYPVVASIPYPECDPMTGNGCGSDELKAAFSIPVLASAMNQSIRIYRTKQKVIAVYRFEARTSMEAEIRLALNSFKGRTQILKHLERTWQVGPGLHELKAVLPRKVIEQKCGTKAAPHCSVLATGELEIGGTDIYAGSHDRKKVTIPKKSSKPRSTKNDHKPPEQR